MKGSAPQGQEASTTLTMMVVVMMVMVMIMMMMMMMMGAMLPYDVTIRWGRCNVTIRRSRSGSQAC